MQRHISYPDAVAAVRTSQQLRRAGLTEREIARQVAHGVLHRIQRNRYVSGELWTTLWPESRQLLLVGAAVAEMRSDGGVMSYESAGALWNLPFYRHDSAAVHATLATGADASSRPGLRRHRDRLDDADITVLGGVRCTTLERTAFDLARTLKIEAAIAAVDAALRQAAANGRRYDRVLADAWRERMLERRARARGARGVRQAEVVIRFADGRAESPGESVSRWQLTEIGFQQLRLQVPVTGPGGATYYVDIEIEDADAFFEFDGAGKYLDPTQGSDRTMKQVLLGEKRREDWIRGTTQKRFVRAESSHITSVEALARRLRAFGIMPPR
ncbi:hypothetical protein [Microbacterium sp. NPDC058389]|uniref:hypothetical protein n=1 Tax=Microbacterium sp. NPDC058389 TaxID=3346475 RepID=UPI003669BB47